MPLFGFDDEFSTYGITPIENQFIREYLPGAQGDYVRVYLYGLMMSYHPNPKLELPDMANTLGLSQDVILSAFRYWQRRRLVRRISDKPPMWQYLSCRQASAGSTASDLVDEAYADFSESLQTLFGSKRQLTGSETMLAYEWVEEMHLPVEVVLMLVQHKITTSGRHFRFQTAQKLAAQMAEENVRNVDDAEQFFTRDVEATTGARKILRKLGQRRNPTDAEIEMYAHWTSVLGFGHDAIEAACAESVSSVNPTFAYLNRVLQGMMSRSGAALKTADDVQKSVKNVLPVKQLLNTLKLVGTSFNDMLLPVYQDMLTMYPDPVIQFAGKVCARNQSQRIEDVMTLLTLWKAGGVQTLEDAERFTKHREAQTKLYGEICYVTHRDRNRKANQQDRVLLDVWQQELGFGRDMILLAAAFAENADNPMPYMNAILSDWNAKGIRDVDTARGDRTAHRSAPVPAAQTTTPQRPTKVVVEQQYTQREYNNVEQDAAHMMARWKELMGRA